jgi:hypothetical protein
MSRPRVRFTVRGLLIAVAIIALLLAGEATRRRWVSLSATYRKRADAFKEKAHSVRVAPHPGDDKERLRLKRLADHYNARVRVYEQAARFPWVKVAPDPPEPQ